MSLEYFDAKEVKDAIIEWIRLWFEKNGEGCSAVCGISGGKDSSVVAALCTEALGKDRVIGVLMPDGEQSDINDSYKLVDHLGIKYSVINIHNAVSDILSRLYYSGIEVSEQTRINLPPRIRMSTLYAVSQSCNGRVACTSNLSEDFVGFFSRWADGIGDFAPIADLLTDEVVEIGRVCGLPEELIVKTPADGLTGKSDEEVLGVTYKDINDYIRTGECEDPTITELVEAKHDKNLFKMDMPPRFEYDRESGYYGPIK